MGSRDKLSKEFKLALIDAFKTHGYAAIEHVAATMLA